MKCVKQGFLVMLLICLVGSPLFAGWDAFRKPSSNFSNTASEVTKEEKMQEKQEALSNEAETVLTATENNSENYEDSSANYDEKLNEARDILVEADAEIEAEKSDRKAEKKKEAVEEAKKAIDELIESKAALDENYNILADIAINQAKQIKHLERQEDFKFGLGLVTGWSWLDEINLGVGFHFLFNEEWDVALEATYGIHCLEGLDQFKNPEPERAEVRIGVTKYF